MNIGKILRFIERAAPVIIAYAPPVVAAIKAATKKPRL